MTIEPSRNVAYLNRAEPMTPDPSPVTAPLPSRVRSAAVASAAFAGVLLAVEAVIVAESWRGLVGFATLIGIHGVAAWGVPVTLDGVSLIAALIALRAELAGESSAIYRLTLFAFTAASAAANYWHGRHAGGAQAALYLGGMSVAVALVFALALRQIRREDRRKAGRVTARLPQFSLAHWLRYPRLTFRALSLSIRDGHTAARVALDAAMVADLPTLDLDGAMLATMPARDRLAAAFGAVGSLDVPRALAVLADRGAPVDQSYAYQLRRQITDGRAELPERTGGE